MGNTATRTHRSGKSHQGASFSAFPAASLTAPEEPVLKPKPRLGNAVPSSFLDLRKGLPGP